MDLSEADEYEVLRDAYKASVGPFGFVTEKRTDGQKICARCGETGASIRDANHAKGEVW